MPCGEDFAGRIHREHDLRRTRRGAGWGVEGAADQSLASSIARAYEQHQNRAVGSEFDETDDPSACCDHLGVKIPGFDPIAGRRPTATEEA
jgi:hypothetical protein